MLRKLLNFVNSIIKVFGVQLYRSGFGMEALLKNLSERTQTIGTIIDIGASDGRWSKMGMDLFPKAKFIAIDPLVEREQQLKKLKSYKPMFDYILCAAGEELEGTTSITVSGDLDGSTIGGTDGVTRIIPVHSLDWIVKEKQCEGPFILKFDSHGYELPILNGAIKTLNQTEYIIMEVYNYHHTENTLLFYEMCTHLESIGFRCFNLADPIQRPIDFNLWQMDLFFARHSNEAFKNNFYNFIKNTD